MNPSEKVQPAPAEKSASGPTTTASKALISAMSKPSILTSSSSKSNGTRASRRISLRGSKRRVDIEKAIAAWGMDTDRTLGSKLTTTHLADLHQIFKKIGHPLTRTEFVKALEDLNIRLEDDVFDLTFLKIDTKLDGEVSWDDVVSFLLIELLENQEVGEPQEDMLRLPISSPPEVFDALHRHPVIRMTFIPEINKDGSVDYMYGKFVTACKEGNIRFWSSSLIHEKTVSSGSALLKVRPTWVTDIVAMPDINIIGTSSTDRELRFYDMTANKWELRVLIWGVDQPVVKMDYHFGKHRSDESCLILGDCGGNIRVLMFNPYRKGPFRQDLGGNVVSVRFADLLKDGLPGLHVVQFLNVHSDWIRQVSYYVKSNSFMSCATCSKASVFMSDVYGTKSQYRYDVPGGVTCFSVTEETHVLVTGGPDCNVRVWNLFVPRKPMFTLIGHHATIVSIVLQTLGNRVYSMDMSRSVRVWNCTNQTCIQTFTKIMAPIGNPFSTYYQSYSRTWMIASDKITVLHCCPKIFYDRTDGFTHTKPVTVVLYNTLFRCVITAGVDSSIMVWDPWRGRRTLLIRNAHMRTVYGKQEGVEITAACFDPPQQQLLTGARNGTLKVWNFNTGNCVRNMTVGSSLEVTSVMWVPQRILAVSWNKLITEWADSGADLYGKQWEARHTDDITCAAVKPPECLASASSNGELVLWQLETGQPYARYNVTQPVHKSGMMHYVEEPVLPPRSGLRVKLPDCLGADTAPPVIHCMQFLTARAVSRGVGTLLVSLSTGRIQMWSPHQVGGYLTDFLAVHLLSDYVACMTVDPECNYLFTGHAAGYIKIWLMSNFCYPGGPTVSLFRPALRKEFPFLNVDRLLGRAKRAVRNQPLPMLLSSLRGHTKPVSSIEFLPRNKMMITGSADHTVRIWTLAGEYIGTLGTFKPWITLAPGVEWDTFGAPNIPADLKRNSSFTTMKVLRRGYVDWNIFLDKAEKNYSAAGTGFYKELTMEELVRGTYGQRLYKPLLGQCFKLPNKALPKLPKIKLDTSLRKVEVFGHIPLGNESIIAKPETPPSIRQGLDIRRSDDSKKKRQSISAVRSEESRDQSSEQEENSPTAEIGERTILGTTKREELIKRDPFGATDKSSPFETTLTTPVVPPSPSKQTSSRKVSIAVDVKTSAKSDSKNELKTDTADNSKSSMVADN